MLARHKKPRPAGNGRNRFPTARDMAQPGAKAPAKTADPAMLDLWARAFSLLGMSLPKTVTPANARGVIDALLAVAETGDDPDDTLPDTTGQGTSDNPSADGNAMLSNRVRLHARDMQSDYRRRVQDAVRSGTPIPAPRLTPRALAAGVNAIQNGFHR